MKKFLKEYLNIIAGATIGIIFLLASFYLLINYYHSQELKFRIYIGENDSKLTNYKNTLNEINNNLKKFEVKKNSNHNYQSMYNHLSTCYTVMNGKGIYPNIETNRFYAPNDIYIIGSKFQSEVLNVCWALHLSSINDDTKSKSFKNVAPFVTNQIDGLNKKVNNSMEELLNNSSYFYTTNITSTIIRNYLVSDYSMITDSYQDFANIVLYLSEIINEEA